jgi:hypothetical protein
MARYKKYNQDVYIKNGLPAKLLFDQRKKYDRLYPKGYGYPAPIDFWLQKNRMYGLMDEQKNILFPRPQFIVQLKGTTNDNLFAFDFVADAFNDIHRYMNGRNGQKLIDDGGRIKKPMKAFKAWDDPIEIRERMDDQIYESFVKQYLKAGNKHKKIKNVEDFFEVFLNLCMRDIVSDIPLTIQGLLLSEITSPMASGLCIEISQDNQSDVFKIFDTYLNNINYKTYVMTASKYGFMVDKNVPFRLVANLSSPKMLAYLENRMMKFLSTPRNSETKMIKKQFLPLDTDLNLHSHQYSVNEDGNGETDIFTDPNGVKHKHTIKNFSTLEAQGWNYPNQIPHGIGPHSHGLPSSESPSPMTLTTFFDRYYFRAIAKDIVNLNNKMFKFYNRYVEQFPYAIDTVACGSERSRKITIDRVSISIADFKEEYSTSFFMKLYFMLRLKELKANVDEDAIKANIKKIDNLYNLVDTSSALGYIERYLKQFY